MDGFNVGGGRGVWYTISFSYNFLDIHVYRFKFSKRHTLITSPEQDLVQGTIQSRGNICRALVAAASSDMKATRAIVLSAGKCSEYDDLSAAVQRVVSRSDCQIDRPTVSLMHQHGIKHTE